MEIAGLDAALPALQRAEVAAVRCLTFSRLPEIECHLRELQERIEAASSRQAQIGTRRQEVGALLREAEGIRVRLKVMEGDLTHRIRAWAQAISQRSAADERVRRMEAVEAALPGREAGLLTRERLGQAQRSRSGWCLPSQSTPPCDGRTRNGAGGSGSTLLAASSRELDVSELHHTPLHSRGGAFM